MRAHLDFKPDIVTHPVILIIWFKFSTESYSLGQLCKRFADFSDRGQRTLEIVDSNYKGRKKSIQKRKFFAQIIVHFATRKRPLLTTNNSQLLLLAIFNGKIRRFSTRAHTIACRESQDDGCVCDWKSYNLLRSPSPILLMLSKSQISALCFEWKPSAFAKWFISIFRDSNK